MAKSADFTINGTAQATLGYDATNGEVLTLALENAPAIDVWKLEFQIVIASKDAPDLVVSPDPMVRFQPPWLATVTMPAEGTDSYQIRSVINGGVDANGRYLEDYYAERIICTRSAIGRRKILPGESTQYSATGWSDEQNVDVDATTEASGVQPSRKITAGNGLQGGGTLEADRTISLKPNVDGSIVADANGTKVGVINDTQHGDLAGGGLHAVAEPSVGGVGGSAGFASPAMAEAAGEVPQMLLDIADNTDAIAALPSTYAPIVHTHAQYTLLTDGTAIANSNKWMIRNAQARAEAMGLTHTSTTKLDVLGPGDLELIAGSNPALTTAAALLRGRTGVKLQVNDATTPATVRTPLEIVREAGGVGTADAILAKCSLSVASASDPGKSMKWLAGGDFSLSTESVNSDGRRYLDHGADGASLSNSSLAIAPKAWAASGGTLTIDCSMSNVHTITVTANTTIALTGTRAGAHYTFDFTGGATGGDITLTAGTSFVRMDALGGPDSLSIGTAGSAGKGFVFGYATSDSGPVRIIHMDSVPTG